MMPAADQFTPLGRRTVTSRVRRRRASSGRFVQGLSRSLIVLVATALVAGCGKREAAADRAAREGVLLQSLGVMELELDPQRATQISEGTVLRALFEGLVTPDPKTLEPRPGVAARWDVSDDGLTYTFFLRANARWSNGDPVTAQDFADSIRRVLTPELGAPNVYLVLPLRGARAFHEKRTADFAQVGAEVIDPHTLRLTLEQPTPHFLATLMHFVWLPVHLASIRAAGGETALNNPWTAPEHIVSNGPFRLVEYRRQQFLRLDANPLYWDAGAVHLHGIKYFAVGSVEVEERNFRAGQLHITDALPIGKIRSYQENRPQVLHVTPSFALYFYRLNVARPPLNDVRVRRALSAAINRQALVRGPLANAHTPAHAFTPPGAGGYDAPALAVDDPEQARRWLAEAGFPGGQGMPHLEILYNKSENHQLVAEIVQDNWRRNLGFEARLANQEINVFLANRSTLNYDVCRASWFGDYLDPLAFLEILTSGNANNQTGWSNPEYDRIVAEAARTMDATRRLALYRDAETILLQEMPVIPLYVQSTIRLVDPRVTGWFDNPMDLHPQKYLGFAP